MKKSTFRPVKHLAFSPVLLLLLAVAVIFGLVARSRADLNPTIARLGTNAIISWTNPAAVLQTSPTLNGKGTWNDVPGAASPSYTVMPSNAAGYFRLRLPTLAINAAITDVEPGYLTTSGGAFYLVGSNFASDATVYIGGVLASVTFINSSLLSVTVGAIGAGTYDVSVFNPATDQTNAVLANGLTVELTPLASLEGPPGLPVPTPATGEVSLSSVDLMVPAGIGPDFILARTYRSRIGPTSSPLGNGWDFSGDVSIQMAGANVVVNDGCGRSDTFFPQSDGTYSRAEFFRQGAFSSGIFTLTFADKSQWQFNKLNAQVAPGKIAKIVDRNGNAMTYAYNSSGQLTKVTDALGRSFQFSWNSSSQLASMQDFAGRTVTYSYDSKGNLQSVTTPAVTGTPNGNDFPSGKTTTYTYTTGFADSRLNHNLTSVTDPTGAKVLTLQYSTDTNPNDLNFDRVLSIAEGTNTPTMFSYTAQTPSPANHYATTQTYINDPVGNVTMALYDSRNRPVQTYQYTGRSTPGVAVTGSANQPAGRLRSSDPAYYQSTCAYNLDSQPTQITDPRGNSEAMVYEYDSNSAAPVRERGNLLTMIQTPAPGAPADQTQRIDQWQYQSGFGTAEVRVEKFHVKQEFGPQQMSRRGDVLCFPTTHTDPRGNNTTASYDANGNLLTVQPPGISTGSSYSYNAAGQMTSQTHPADANGRRQQDSFYYYTSGAQNGYLQNTVEDAGGQGVSGLALTTSYAYDAYGNVTNIVDPRGNNTEMVYNQLDQLMRVSSPAGPGGMRSQMDLTYATDEWPENGDLDFNDAIAMFGTGRVIGTSVLDFDQNGTLATDSPLTTSYGYDQIGQLTSVTNEVSASASTVTRYSYGDSGEMTGETSPLAASGADAYNTMRYSYDERGLPFQETAAPGGTGQSTTQYNYDANGNPASVSEGLEGTPRTTTMVANGFAGSGDAGLAMAVVWRLYGEGKGTRKPDAGPAMAGRDGGLYHVIANNPTTVQLREGVVPLNNVPIVSLRDGGLYMAASVYSRYKDLDPNLAMAGAARVHPPANNWATFRAGLEMAASVYSGYKDLDPNLARARGVFCGDHVVKPDLIAPGNKYRDAGFAMAVSKDSSWKEQNPQEMAGSIRDNTKTGTVTLRIAGPQIAGRGKLNVCGDGIALGSSGLQNAKKKSPAGVPWVPANPSLPHYTRSGRFDKILVYEPYLQGDDSSLGVVTDPQGNVTSNHFDANDNLVSTTVNGTNGVPISGGNVLLSSSTAQYDALNRLTNFTVSILNASGTVTGSATTSAVFADNGETTALTDADGHTTTFAYDTVSRLSSIADPKGNSTSYAYDANDNVTAVTNRLKSDLRNPDLVFAQTCAYDNLNRLTSATDNVGNTETCAYDSRGDVVQTTDPRGIVSQYQYDGLSRLTASGHDMDGDGNAFGTVDIVTSQTYDNNSRLVSQTDPNGNVTSYAYDSLNRCTATTNADLTVSSVTYDIHSDETSSTDANGTVVACAYDALDQLTATSITPGSGVATTTTSEQYSYDGLGRTVYAANNNSTNSFTYDSLSRPLTDTKTDVDLTVSNTYDAVGNCLTTTYPGGRKLGYTYDAADLCTGISLLATSDGDTLGLISSNTYVGGLSESCSNRNGTYSLMGYDGAVGAASGGDSGWGQVSSIQQYNSSVPIIDSVTLSYDAAQNKISRSTASPGLTNVLACHYDNASRLTNAVVTTNSVLARNTVYNFDKAGNRTSVTGETCAGAYTMSSTIPPADFQMNQYTTTPCDSRTYDDDGNLASVSSAAGPVTYQYDYADRLAQVQALNSGTGTLEPLASYAYDALGRRISKTVYPGGLPPATTQFLYDVNCVVEERAGGVTTATYAILKNDESDLDCGGGKRLAMTRNGHDYYSHNDDQGNALALTDSTGAVVERYDYDDYGAVTFLTSNGAPTSATSSAVGNAYCWGGLRFDPETGLHNDDGGDYFEPQTGRAVRGKVKSIKDMGTGCRAFDGNNPWSPPGPLDPLGMAINKKGIPGGSKIRKLRYYQ